MEKETTPDEKIRHQISEWRLRGCLAAFGAAIGYLFLPGGVLEGCVAVGLLGVALGATLITSGGYGIRGGSDSSVKPYPKTGGFATGAFFAGCCMTILILLISALSRR